MTGVASLQLVSAPAPERKCPCCHGALTAIEVWHGCPELRLAYGLHQLRLDFRRQITKPRRIQLARAKSVQTEEPSNG